MKSLLKPTKLCKKAKQGKVNSKKNPNLKKVKNEKPLLPVALIGKKSKQKKS